MSQVQDSSTCCINSKLSSSASGYFCDDYLIHFTNKLHRRSPIINRGYYIRFKAIEQVFESWWTKVDGTKNQAFQIVSLGAGLDSTYFRLKSNKKLPPVCHYIEVDFLEVMRKKLLCVKKFLPSLFSEDQNLKSDNIVFHSPEYSLLGVDLCDVNSLTLNLKLVGIEVDVPTLFLSECSITYMEQKDSGALINYVQQNFPNSIFVAYEQAYPDDAFGIVMQRHFVLVGCALKSISLYPDKASQEKRFTASGWATCHCITVYEFQSSLPAEERERISQLELFDEYEMWHEKCHHYVVVQASQGIFSGILHLVPHRCITSLEKPPVSVDLKCLQDAEVFQRFGHASVLVSSSVVMICGGFGVSNKKHKKMDKVVFYDVKSAECLSVHPADCFRMHHTATKLSGPSVVLLGGRKSPKNICGSISIVHYAPPFDSGQMMTVPCTMPVPVWRHSASLISLKGVEYIFVFGGISEEGVATSKSFLLNVQTWEWSEVPSTMCTPPGRHSHSSAAFGDSVIISGGLSATECILQSVHLFRATDRSWSTLQVLPGLFPRFSHSSEVWKNHLFLIGGITSVPNIKPGVGVVNLLNSQAYEVDLPGLDPERPVMLCNHSSCLKEENILILGGGGNCFSFGTHFNQGLWLLSCRTLLDLINKD